MANSEKKGKGRQRVAMVRMENGSNRLVTFSKRRCGLFKKASELCILCGVEVAILVFSPGRRIFSFGHPSVDTLVNRYLTTIANINDDNNNNNVVISNLNINENDDDDDDDFSTFNMELTLLNHQIEGEKKHNHELLQLRKLKQEELRGLDLIEKLNLTPLKQLHGSLSMLGNLLLQLGNKFTLKANPTTNPLTIHHFPSNEMMDRQIPFKDNLSLPSNATTMGSTSASPPSLTPWIRVLQEPFLPNGGSGFNVAPFQGAHVNNPIGFRGELVNGFPLSFNVGVHPPLSLSGNSNKFTSPFMDSNSMDDVINAPPFNPQGGFGFGHGIN